MGVSQTQCLQFIMEKDKDKENDLFDKLRYIHKYQSKCISNNTDWIRVQDEVQDVSSDVSKRIENVSNRLNSSGKAISNCTKRVKNESGHHRAVFLNGSNISLNSITAEMILSSDDKVAVYLSDVTNINQNRLEAMFRELINQDNQIICSVSSLRESSSDKSNDQEQKEWEIFVPDVVKRMDQQFHSLQSILLDCESMRNYEEDNCFTNKSCNKTFYNHGKVNDRTKLTRLPCSYYYVKRKDESLFSIAELKKSFPVDKLVQDQAVDIVNQSVSLRPMTDITKRRRLETRKRAEERYNAAINSSSSESSADES